MTKSVNLTIFSVQAMYVTHLLAVFLVLFSFPRKKLTVHNLDKLIGNLRPHNWASKEYIASAHWSYLHATGNGVLNIS